MKKEWLIMVMLMSAVLLFPFASAVDSPYIYVNKSGSDMNVSWLPVTDATSYNVYRCNHTGDKPNENFFWNCSANSSSFMENVADEIWYDAGAYDSGDNHTYYVTACDGSSESAVSNAGWVLRKFINENPATTDINFITLPYEHPYDGVADFVAEVSPAGNPIDTVTDWVEEDQQYRSYIWIGFMWVGPDFALEQGKHYQVTNQVADNTITLYGSNDPDFEVPLNENPAKTDINFIGLPYNSIYDTVTTFVADVCPSGNPIDRVIDWVAESQQYRSYIWLGFMWAGPDFENVIGTGWQVTNQVGDTTFDPTEVTPTHNLVGCPKCGCSNGTYNYTCGNITYESCTMNCDLATNGTCLEIGADNIVIDGAGYLINYSSITGIDYAINASAGFDNITIKDLIINQTNRTYGSSTTYHGGGGIGIFFNNSDNSVVEYVNVSGGRAMVLAMNSFNTTVRHSQGSNLIHGYGDVYSTCHPFKEDTKARWYETGIWLAYSNNGFIYNNTIYGNKTSSGRYNHDGTEAGISLCSSNNTNASYNYIYFIDTFGFNLARSYNNSIFYNFVNGSSIESTTNTNDGIIFGGGGGNTDKGPCSDNNISHNEFYMPNEIGIFLANSNNNSFYNNSIYNGTSAGLRLGGTSAYNYFLDNTAESCGNGFIFEAPLNVVVNHTSKYNDKGTYFESDGENNSITNFYSYNDNYGVFFSIVNYNTFIDSIIEDAITNDIYVQDINDDTINDFINCTFNQSNTFYREITGTTGGINVKWYWNSFSRTTDGTPIHGTFVELFNNSDTLIFSEYSGSDGYTSTQNITEYYENFTGKYFQTNYTVNGSYSDYDDITIYLNLTESMTTTLIFGGTTGQGGSGGYVAPPVNITEVPPLMGYVIEKVPWFKKWIDEPEEHILFILLFSFSVVVLMFGGVWIIIIKRKQKKEEKLENKNI